MAAPLDLVGRVFGRLTVLARDGHVKFGDRQPAWLCRCACGAEITVAQRRLPHRPSIVPAHRLDACPACRTKPCIVCSAPIPVSLNKTTCSDQCRAAHRRSIWRSHYHRQAAGNPGFRDSQNRLRAERLATQRADPAFAEQEQTRERTRYIRRRAARLADPDLANQERRRRQEWYHRNAERVLQERRERLAQLSSEEFGEYRESMRAYLRKHQIKMRDIIRSDIDLRTSFLDQQAEYRRRRRLAAMMMMMMELSTLSRSIDHGA